MFKYIFCFGVLVLGTQALSPPVTTCDLPKETGPCRGFFRKYFYNRESGKCEKFVYGGCKGNANNFDSLDECEQICGVCPPVSCYMHCEFGFDVDSNGCEICKCRPPPHCDLPKETGPCRGHFQKYFYNKVSGKCEKFVYGGCKGNANNFDSLAECGKKCVGACPDAMCFMHCEHGFEVDENGCKICKCEPPPQCSDVMCMMYCENGFQVDKNGCDICKCKPPPKCSDVMCMMYCEHGFQVDKNGCDICKCKPPPKCSDVMCMMHCEHGFQVDNNGCEICECKPPPPCSDEMCEMFCVHGFRVDKNGCEICECNPPPPFEKPGRCPRDSFKSVMCPLILHQDDCTGDGSCPRNQKCCPYGCKTRCAPPS